MPRARRKSDDPPVLVRAGSVTTMNTMIKTTRVGKGLFHLTFPGNYKSTAENNRGQELKVGTRAEIMEDHGRMLLAAFL